MPTHTENLIVPYSAAQMFELVADIEQYPKFLPWCVGMRVRDRGLIGEFETVTADMLVAFKALREQFTSEVTLNTENNRIDIRYIDGPFRHLKNRWQFIPQSSGGCAIDFFIDFEFKSRSLRFVMNKVFGRAVAKMVSAFEQRAHALYGTKQAGTVSSENSKAELIPH